MLPSGCVGPTKLGTHRDLCSREDSRDPTGTPPPANLSFSDLAIDRNDTGYLCVVVRGALVQRE